MAAQSGFPEILAFGPTGYGDELLVGASVSVAIAVLAYSLGLGIPFFCSAIALHRFLIFFNRYRRYIRLMEIVTGGFLIIVGILIFANYLSRLSQLFSGMFGGI